MEYAPLAGDSSGSFDSEAPSPTDGGDGGGEGAYMVPPDTHRDQQHHLHGHQLTP